MAGMIKQYLEQVIRAALGPDIPTDVAFVVEHPREASHGDWSTNIAMVLAKRLKQVPLKIATELVPKIISGDAKKYFSKVEAAKPGFINIYLSPAFNQGIVSEILKSGERFGRAEVGRGKKIVLEYAQPNTNKPMHLGHFRLDAIGMAVHNLLEAVGFDVILTTIFNDRGQHICKSILMYQKFGRCQTPETAKIKGDHFVGGFYTRYEEESAKDPTLADEVAQMLIKWENNDPEIRALWKKMNGWVYAGFDQTFQREGTRLDEKVYESDIYKKGKEIVEKYLKKGIFMKKPDESVVVDLIKFGLDEKVLLRADGTTIYITQDLYLGEYREKKYHPERMLYCVDIYQGYHFQVLFAIYELIGYKFAKHCKHLAFGYVFLGKEKMSSRKGNVVTTDKFLDEMKERARAVMKQSKIQAPKENEDQVAEAMALAAVKYGILRYELQKDIRFDPEMTIQLTGDTGPYLQYTYARIRGIMRKGKITKIGELATALGGGQAVGAGLDKPEEQKLLRQLTRYPEVVEKAALAYSPNLLAEYLGDLSRTFNAFYNSLSVLKAESEKLKQSRLSLCAATAQTLKNGLALLGIEALEKM